MDNEATNFVRDNRIPILLGVAFVCIVLLHFEVNRLDRWQYFISENMNDLYRRLKEKDDAGK